MSALPEAKLAREAELAYALIATGELLCLLANPLEALAALSDVGTNTALP